IASKGKAPLSSGRAQFGGVEGPLISLAVWKPVFGPEHTAATHSGEFEPVLSAHSSVGASFIRIISHISWNIQPTRKEVPVCSHEQAGRKGALERRATFGEVAG